MTTRAGWGLVARRICVRQSLHATLVARTRGRVYMAPPASSEVRLACSVFNSPRRTSAARRSLRAADAMDRLRLRHKTDGEMPCPYVQVRACARGDGAAFVPRAACRVCGPLPQQKQYTMCKRAFQHSLPPQAQGSTGLVVAFKARHGSAITNAIMGQPHRPNLRQSQDHAVAPSTAQSLMARVCLCVCIVRFLSKLAPKDEIRS